MIKQEPKYHLIKLNIPSLQLFHLKSKAAVQHGAEYQTEPTPGFWSQLSAAPQRGRQALTRFYLVSYTIEPCSPDSESAAMGRGQESPQAIRPVWEHLDYKTSLPKLLPSPAPQIPRFPNKQHSQSQAFPNSYIPSP